MPSKFGMWHMISAVLAVLLIISVFTNGFSGGVRGSMSAQDTAAKIVTYLNMNVLQGQTATLGQISDSGSVYAMQITVAGKTYNAFASKDGRYFFPSGLDVTQAPEAVAPAPKTNVDMKALATGGHAEGAANAPVTMIEFSDFQCPFCGRFFEDAYPQIKKDYIDTGKVQLIFRNFPLTSIHPNAQPAAEAAECADEQGKFWQYHDQLFTNQAMLSVENYKQWAKDLGLDTKKFNDCVDTHKYASKVSKDESDGQAAGVDGTPAFFVNGALISGAQPYGAFKAAIDAALVK